MPKFARIVVFSLALILWSGSSQAVTIDFDDLPGNSIQAGNVYAGLGVTFTTGEIPNTLSVGDTITLGSPVEQFYVGFPTAAVSPPNVAVPLGCEADTFCTNDLLFSFSPAPINTIELTLDSSTSGDPSDVVRLLALAATANPYEFQVIEVTEATDSSQTTLSLSRATSFSFALFQLTAEREGFDDLTFASVPEPTTLIFVSLGLAILVSTGRSR